jgi:hypothetical protein
MPRHFISARRRRTRSLDHLHFLRKLEAKLMHAYRDWYTLYRASSLQGGELQNGLRHSQAFPEPISASTSANSPLRVPYPQFRRRGNKRGKAASSCTPAKNRLGSTEYGSLLPGCTIPPLRVPYPQFRRRGNKREKAASSCTPAKNRLGSTEYGSLLPGCTIPPLQAMPTLPWTHVSTRGDRELLDMVMI